jgi:2-isopropylmalate synthase
LAYRFRNLGFEFTRNDIDVLYERFLEVADNKKEVQDDDLKQLAARHQPAKTLVS